MPAEAADFRRLLSTLLDHDVAFIIVGGVGAVLQGAPVVTFDLDIVHSRAPENVARLHAALASLSAVSRLHLPQRIAPDESHLSSPGHQLLATDAGPLDVLGAVGRDRSYEALLPHADLLEFEPGRFVRVLDLATQIEVKQEAGRPKDLAALPLLRATLEERRRG